MSISSLAASPIAPKYVLLTNRKSMTPDLPADGTEKLVFTLPSSLGKESEVSAYDRPEQAAPALQRPVLLIHGFTGAPENWKNMRTWLTSQAANGDGGVVDPNSTSVDSKAKVFLMKFSRPFNSTKTNAAELRQVIDKIASATGSREIDLVGHSMGGLDARYYLEEGGEKVKNLVMIATPNRGSVLADNELKFREMGLPVKPEEDDPEVRQCVRDLCEDKVVNGKQNNPTLHEMNNTWSHQKDSARILLIAGNGHATLQSSTLLTMWGDGTVPQNSVKMDGVPLKNIWGPDHSGVKEHPDALIATANFLTDKSVDLTSQAPPNVKPDREFIPLQISASVDKIEYLIQDKQPK